MKKKPAGLKSTNNSPLPARDNMNYKNNNKKQSNKGLCPFACPNCQSLGGDVVKSKYEIVNILSDTGDSIFSPMHEKYTEEHKSSIRNGKVFIAAEVVVDNLLQKLNK